MPRMAKRLTARVVETIGEPGEYADGDNLYLRVQSKSSKSWLFRCKLKGRIIVRGLGSTRLVGLAEAREGARKMRVRVSKGLSPEAGVASSDPVLTFKEVAEDYIHRRSKIWSSKHASQWTNTLRDYVYPLIGQMKVSDITIREIRLILDPIWEGKTETASRVRGRVETILNMARSMKLFSGENPAVWKGNLDLHYPSKSRAAPVKHHASIHYRFMPRIFKSLVLDESQASTCVSLISLLGCRLSELAQSRRSEFDFVERVWTVPAERVGRKSQNEHRVPLSSQALNILAVAPDFPGEALMFPNSKGRHFSDVTLNKALKRHAAEIPSTVHGLRTTFRTWAEERSNYSERTKEYSLSHYSEKSEKQPYLRTDLLEERRILMQDWADFLASS